MIIKSKIDPFMVTNNEFKSLNEMFGELAFFAAWQLKRKNVKNNHTEDMDDIMQQLYMAIIRAGRYYKRQIYIEACLDKVCKYACDKFIIKVVKELKNLWDNRTKHGANKQKFGEHQENLLDFLTSKYVPKEERPNPTADLQIDKKFVTYCKAIAWNAQKSLGRKISRERTIRYGQVSLSDFPEVSFLKKNVF